MIGLVAGVFSTMFGVGGGTVMVPLLVLLLRYDTKVATATSLAAIIVTASVGVAAHGLLDNVAWSYAALVGLPAVGGLFAGLWLKDRLSTRALTTAFAALLVAVATWLLVEQSAQGTHPDLTVGRAAIVVGLGACAGVLAGLFGVGGGILFVPALALIVGLSQSLATGTSLLAIIPVSIVGSWRQSRARTVRWRPAMTMGGVSALTAVGGALVNEYTPPRAIKIMFAGLLVFTATQLVRRARSA